MKMTRLMNISRQWIVAVSLPAILSACSDSKKVEVSEAELLDSNAIVAIDLSSDDGLVLGQLTHLLETVRDAKNHDKPLTKAEHSEINELITKVKALQNDPEAMRQIEQLESNLAELKGVDKSQVSFDTQLLKP